MKLFSQANPKSILLKSFAVAAAIVGITGGAKGQLPVTTGLVLRMDASQITGTSDGAQLAPWPDTSGQNNSAIRQATSTTGFPKYVAAAVNSQSVVRFDSSNLVVRNS